MTSSTSTTLCFPGQLSTVGSSRIVEPCARADRIIPKPDKLDLTIAAADIFSTQNLLEQSALDTPIMGEKITEEQVANLLALIRTDASVDAKVNQINTIKSGIKQHNVPDASISVLFEAVRIAMTAQQAALVNAGFSTLNHLLTRLSRQEPKYITKEAARTLPLVVEKMGDQKDKFRQVAAQCLTTIWFAAPMDVERAVKNTGMISKSSRAKEACMKWVVQVGITPRSRSSTSFTDYDHRCTRNTVYSLSLSFQHLWNC